MEQYLQELDKINELLVFTDKRPFQLWNFFANNFSFILLAILITGIITKGLYEYSDWDVGETIINTKSPEYKLV